MALLEVQRASFSYKEKDIFNNISFKVNRGRLFCLFGPNGCGKSTLLECIMGLMKLKNGHITINGEGIEKMKPEKLAKYIAYVPQVHEKTFPYTVLDFILMARTSYTNMFSSPRDEDYRIVEEAMKAMGIFHFRDRPYTQLSGGELQLVMITRALAQQTPIIVMDEPTSHLDFKNDIAILEIVTKLVREKNLAIIMATHFPNHGFYFENKGVPIEVLFMNKKENHILGKPSEVFSEENMRNIFNIESKLIKYKMDGDKLLRQIVPLNSVS